MKIGQSVVSTEEYIRLKVIQAKYMESKEGIYVSEEMNGRFPHSEMSIYKSVRYIGHIEALKMLDDEIKRLLGKNQVEKDVRREERVRSEIKINKVEAQLSLVKNATFRQRLAFLFKREIPGTSE